MNYSTSSSELVVTECLQLDTSLGFSSLELGPPTLNLSIALIHPQLEAAYRTIQYLH